MKDQSFVDNKWSAPPALTIYQVETFEGEFSPAGVLEADWLFDLSVVVDIDCAGLQWLMSVRNRLFNAGRRLNFINVPPALEQVIDLISLGIDQSGPFPEHVTDA